MIPNGNDTIIESIQKIFGVSMTSAGTSATYHDHMTLGPYVINRLHHGDPSKLLLSEFLANEALRYTATATVAQVDSTPTMELRRYKPSDNPYFIISLTFR